MLAYYLPIIFSRGEAIIARGTAIFFGLCAGSFLPAYVGALYWKRITKAGAVAGMLGGFFASAFWLIFVHIKESSVIGLSQAIFGQPALFGKPWIIVDPLFISLPISIVLTVAVSLLTKPPEQSHIDKCFRNL
jgi:SSS family solute:Na+ symporter